MNIGIVGVNTGNIQAYQTAIKGLSAEQAVFALATKGVNAAQIEEIMTTETATLAKGTYTEADVQAALAKNGLTSSATILTTAQQKEFVQSGLITSEKLAEVAATLGLTTAEDGSLVTKKSLNAEMVKQQLESMGVIGASQKQERPPERFLCKTPSEYFTDYDNCITSSSSSFNSSNDNDGT